jgi:hypothetical protein
MFRTRWIVSTSLALALSACTTTTPDRTPASGSVGPEARPARALVSSPAVAQLSPASRAELVRTPFPMLVLPAQYAERSVVMAEAHWAAVSWSDRDQEPLFALTVTATDVWNDLGDDSSQVHPTPPTTDTVRGLPATTATNEGIRFVSWIDGNIAWTLDVMCFDHEHDVRCTESGFAIELANSLVPAHVGSQGPTPGAIGAQSPDPLGGAAGGEVAP